MKQCYKHADVIIGGQPATLKLYDEIARQSIWSKTSFVPQLAYDNKDFLVSDAVEYFGRSEAFNAQMNLVTAEYIPKRLKKLLVDSNICKLMDALRFLLHKHMFAIRFTGDSEARKVLTHPDNVLSADLEWGSCLALKFLFETSNTRNPTLPLELGVFVFKLFRDHFILYGFIGVQLYQKAWQAYYAYMLKYDVWG